MTTAKKEEWRYRHAGQWRGYFTAFVSARAGMGLSLNEEILTRCADQADAALTQELKSIPKLRNEEV